MNRINRSLLGLIVLLLTGSCFSKRGGEAIHQKPDFLATNTVVQPPYNPPPSSIPSNTTSTLPFGQSIDGSNKLQDVSHTPLTFDLGKSNSIQLNVSHSTGGNRTLTDSLIPSFSQLITLIAGLFAIVALKYLTDRDIQQLKKTTKRLNSLQREHEVIMKIGNDFVQAQNRLISLHNSLLLKIIHGQIGGVNKSRIAELIGTITETCEKARYGLQLTSENVAEREDAVRHLMERYGNIETTQLIIALRKHLEAENASDENNPDST